MHRRAGTETRPYTTDIIPIAPRDSSRVAPVQNDISIKWFVILREVKRPKYLSVFRSLILNIDGGSKPPPYK